MKGVQTRVSNKSLTTYIYCNWIVVYQLHVCKVIRVLTALLFAIILWATQMTAGELKGNIFAYKYLHFEIPYS